MKSTEELPSGTVATAPHAGAAALRAVDQRGVGLDLGELGGVVDTGLGLQRIVADGALALAVDLDVVEVVEVVEANWAGDDLRLFHLGSPWIGGGYYNHGSSADATPAIRSRV
jgi:hypothetical protein